MKPSTPKKHPKSAKREPAKHAKPLQVGMKFDELLSRIVRVKPPDKTK